MTAVTLKVVVSNIHERSKGSGGKLIVPGPIARRLHREAFCWATVNVTSGHLPETAAEWIQRERERTTFPRVDRVEPRPNPQQPFVIYSVKGLVTARDRSLFCDDTMHLLRLAVVPQDLCYEYAA